MEKEIKRMKYADCDKGGLHEFEKTNIICQNNECQNNSLCCMVCVDQFHQHHNYVPLKYQILKVINNQQPAQLNQSFLDSFAVLQESLINNFKEKFPQTNLTEIITQILQICELYKSALSNVTDQEREKKTLLQSFTEQEPSYDDFNHNLTKFFNYFKFDAKNNLQEQDDIDFKTNVESFFDFLNHTMNIPDLSDKDLLENYNKFLIYLRGTNLLQTGTFEPMDNWSNSIQIRAENHYKSFGAQSYKYAIFQPKINPFSVYRFGFKMIDGDFKWVGIGVCHTKSVIKNRYQFKYTEPQHGNYMISSNGGVWSSSDSSKNNKIKSFKYGRGDTIVCEVSPFKKNVIFRKYGTEEQYQIELSPKDIDSLQPAILFYYSDNVVKFINNFK